MNNNKRFIIDLDNYRDQNAKVFIGYNNGKDVSRHVHLINKFDKFEEFEIIVPEGTFAVNPSFLEGLLEEAILHFGAKEFKIRFNFITVNNLDINSDINETIDRVLRQI